MFISIECWYWYGKRFPDSEYGVHDGTTAHRYVYQLVGGQLSTSHVLDHLCNNPPCVNPWHMEPKTQRLNVLRGSSPAANNARKKSCVNNHNFNESNTYHYKGMRYCRQCQRERSRAWKAKQR